MCLIFPLIPRYYLGTLTGRPDVRHVFRVQDASTHNDTTPVSSECLSCNSNHNLVNVSTCQYARAKMSKDFSHYALDCMGPTGILDNFQDSNFRFHIKSYVQLWPLHYWDVVTVPTEPAVSQILWKMGKGCENKGYFFQKIRKCQVSLSLLFVSVSVF